MRNRDKEKKKRVDKEKEELANMEVDVKAFVIEDEEWKLVHEVKRKITNEGVNFTKVIKLPKVIVVVERAMSPFIHDLVMEAVADVRRMGYRDVVRINKTQDDAIVWAEDLKIIKVPPNHFYVLGYEW